MAYRKISFGDLKVRQRARALLDRALDKNWVSEGENVAEFERLFANKFGWKHAIATSSGTDAGIVVWAAIRELTGLDWGSGYVFTPACAFVATANCLRAAGLNPYFIDIDLDTLNMSPEKLGRLVNIDGEDIEAVLMTIDRPFAGIQYVATLGKPSPVEEIAEIAERKGAYLVADMCEAHGAMLNGGYADHYAHAAIYSLYTAHLVVAGEGGVICTDDDEIAALCRSIKSHGRRGGLTYFAFDRVGYNSKMNDLTAALGIEAVEYFDATFDKRRFNRNRLLDKLTAFEDRIILYPDAPGEVICPHAFPIVLRDENADINALYRFLEEQGVQVKTLFGSIPTQHKAYADLCFKLGDFPVAERVGRTGLHFGVHEYLVDDDIDHIVASVRDGLKTFY
jgi:perosamine synthetase